MTLLTYLRISCEWGGAGDVRCAVCRVFRVRLKRDDDVYSQDIAVENATHVVSFDASRAYRGHVEGRSLVP